MCDAHAKKPQSRDFIMDEEIEVKTLPDDSNEDCEISVYDDNDCHDCGNEDEEEIKQE